MSDSELLVTALARLARLMAADDVAAVLEHVLVSATDLLHLSGATVLRVWDEAGQSEGHPASISASTESLAELARSQLDAARGPALEAMRHGEAVTVTEIGKYLDVWPEYASAAERHGMSSVASTPLRHDDLSFGALCIYSAERRDWAPPDLSVGELLAELTAGHLVTVDRLREKQQLADQLQHALDARIVIEQAKGVIANARNITPDAAYKLIRTHARRNRISVQAVATGIVELRLRI
ncbi:GAF and ANTAR domain-containing protein [Nocardia goodfellowii]|uniref:GAF domain-containing protein n=1 Tax=Nocardia goodfellowii TaxID=882446 RepID=A0ABS4QG21_9NOCA|nr:GAF and ANTAR domain-containing protein [Nocardia goodfellowii]MBP2190100.1 GAF domain-containing protein [Nocardia goodfellowii]